MKPPEAPTQTHSLGHPETADPPGPRSDAAGQPAGASPGPASRGAAEAPPAESAHHHLYRLFRLTPAEQAALELLLDAGALTLDELRGQLDLGPDDLAGLLTPDAPLRAHGLIEVDEAAALGVLRRTDTLYPARGLEQIFDGTWGRALPLEQSLPGLEFYPAPAADVAWAQDLLAERAPPLVAQLVREHLVAQEPRLVEIAPHEPSHVPVPVLARLLRMRLMRPVVTLECAALVGAAHHVLLALRRLRRDADLRGAVIIASDAHVLGGAVRGLCAPAPAGHTTPVVLLASAPLRGVAPLPQATRGEGRLVHHVVGPRKPAESAGDGEAPAPAVEAAREEVRRKAAVDAARAMGRPIPRELTTPTQAAPAAAAQAAAAQAASAQAASAQAASAQTPVPDPEPAQPARPTSREAAREMARQLAKEVRAAREAAAAAGPAAAAAAGATTTATAPAAAKTDGGEGAVAPGGPTEAIAPGTAASAPGTEASVTEASAPGTGASVTGTGASAPGGATAVAAAPEAAGDQAPALAPDPEPVPLAEDAPLDEVVRVARTTPSARQRIELLQVLAGKRSPLVIQVFRGNLASPNAAVRAAAEAGMASIFGPDWNRTRAITPPVQPPRSDDNGRGPGGAF